MSCGPKSYTGKWPGNPKPCSQGHLKCGCKFAECCLGCPLEKCYWETASPPAIIVPTLPAESPERIVAEVANQSGITLDEMLGPGRSVRVVAARRAAARELKARTDLTLGAIALQLGRHNHATVLNLLNGKNR